MHFALLYTFTLYKVHIYSVAKMYSVHIDDLST